MKKPIYKRWWFGVILVIAMIGVIGCSGESEPQQMSQESQIEQSQDEVAGEELAEESDMTLEPDNQGQSAETSGETLSQKNAVKKAELYLRTMPFSKNGLIEQLEFDGYDKEDAVYAVNKISVDWKEQAVLKGELYLDMMPFSKKELIEQLIFEGFSEEEATYAVQQLGY